MSGTPPQSADNDGDLGPPPPTLSVLGLSEKQWRDIETASRRHLPRFLFRGFHARSGGDTPDPRRNNNHEIVPEGFLDGSEPTSIYDIPNLKQMIYGHIHTNPDPALKTRFSSWALSLQQAAWYAEEQKLAIVDTSKLPKNVKVYYVPILTAGGIVPSPEGYEFGHEYIIYGPVRGEGYRVTNITIMAQLNIERETIPPPVPLTFDYRYWAQYIKMKMERCIIIGSYAPEVTVILGAALMCEFGRMPLAVVDAAADELSAVFADQITAMKVQDPIMKGRLANPDIVAVHFDTPLAKTYISLLLLIEDKNK
ncbi:hypothetical protein F5Y16DRAFT_400358 [Xylariaceae sp. FL0255]|nr:hypothetical protein F5Y16DRAFT_400358 [Xylariaceae sp. FL0255]